MTTHGYTDLQLPHRHHPTTIPTHRHQVEDQDKTLYAILDSSMSLLQLHTTNNSDSSPSGWSLGQDALRYSGLPDVANYYPKPTISISSRRLGQDAIRYSGLLDVTINPSLQLLHYCFTTKQYQLNKSPILVAYAYSQPTNHNQPHHNIPTTFS